MFGKKKFLNFIDLMNLRAGKSLQKLAIEQSVKEAHKAFSAGRDSIISNGIPTSVQHSRSKGTPYFKLVGSVPVEAWVYKSERGDSNFVRVELGISSEEVQEDEAVTYSQPDFLTLTGRVQDAEGGDPSVYFFDPDEKTYAQGFVDALSYLKTVLGDDLGGTVSDLRQVIDEETVDDIERTGVEVPW